MSEVLISMYVDGAEQVGIHAGVNDSNSHKNTSTGANRAHLISCDREIAPPNAAAVGTTRLSSLYIESSR